MTDKPTQKELVCSDVLPTGTWVMLREDAPQELALIIGLAAVMRIFCQSGLDLKENGDGDLVARRRYWVVHEHRGRLMQDIPEDALRVIPHEVALGQKLLHAEMTRDLLPLVEDAIRHVLDSDE